MKTPLLLLCLLFLGCSPTNEQPPQPPPPAPSADAGEIAVLNLGTFHMGQSSDANTIEYDEAAAENKRQINEVCTQLARFEPTVICLEIEPDDQAALAAAYASYRNDPTQVTEYGDSEIELLGFAIGLLAGTERVYGIDHKLEYDYDQAALATQIGATGYFTEQDYLQENIGMFSPRGSLSQTFARINTPSAYDILIGFNADLLAHANSADGFEGADEAAKYYHRNLRIFANLNKLPLTAEDRVLIISGASHAAFLDTFFRRSQKYRTVEVTKYLTEELAESDG